MAGLDARVAELREALRALREKAAASGERRDVIDAAMARLQDTATAARVSAASAQSAGGRLRPTAWPRHSARPRS